MSIVAHQLEEEDPKKSAGLEIKISPWRETVERQVAVLPIAIPHLQRVGLNERVLLRLP